VDIAENAFVSYAAEHPEPANGTLVEGLPSGTYWSFDNGQREPAAPNSSAIAIDDRGLDGSLLAGAAPDAQLIFTYPVASVGVRMFCETLFS